MNTHLLILVAIAVFSYGVYGQQKETDDQLQAGTGIIDITGKDAVVLDPLHVKAMYFSQGDEQVLLVECDVTGMPDKVITAARKGISVKTGIPTNRIAVAATHTHMANSHKELTPAIISAAEEAIKNSKPVNIYSATGQEFNVAHNRRYFMKDGSVVFNPMFLNPEIVRPAGPIDPDVGFLLLKNSSNNKPIASITNYALHLDIVKQYGAVYQKEGEGSRNSVSADFPYWLEKNLKKQFGSDFSSFFITGACGNINHWDFSKPGPQSGHETKSKEVGDSLYQAIERILPGLHEDSPTLRVLSRTVEVPLQTFTPEELEWAQNVNSGQLSSKSEEPSERRQFLDRVKRNRILWLNEQKQQGKTTISIDILAVRLSESAAIATLPGEMFVEHGITLKNFSPFENTMIMELTNSNDISYVPDKRAFKQGGYEVENSTLAPGGAEMLISESIRLLKELDE